MSVICPACSNPNPLDHSFCHQCGTPLENAQQLGGDRVEASATVERRAPDETRLPPAGSFRSGVYRLVRALLYSQGTSAYRPARDDTQVSWQEQRSVEDAPSVDSTTSVAPTVDSMPLMSVPAPDSDRSPASLQNAAYWLTRAMLLRPVLPLRTIIPARRLSRPGPRAETPLATIRAASVAQATARTWRVPSGLGDGVSSAATKAGVVLARMRGTLAADDGVAVPQYLEVGAVVALTLVALLLRVWNLPDAPAGIHGDETEMAMEALRSIKGESLGIWTGVTLGNPAGYAHWMSVIFRIGGADVTTMRLASAIPGAAIIPVGYLLVRCLYPFRVAIFSAVLLSLSFWFVIQSRIAVGGITSVFMALLAMWLLVLAVQHRRIWVAVAAGIALGLGLYTFKIFPFYLAGIWGAALLSMLVSQDLRRKQEVWLCLAVSALVGAPLLLFYATSGYVGSNLNDIYHVSPGDPWTWVKIPSLALDALLLVNRPVQGNTVDGAPAIPIFGTLASLFFWAGLAAVFLFIKERRYQLLLAGLLIGMAPVLFVPRSRKPTVSVGHIFRLGDSGHWR